MTSEWTEFHAESIHPHKNQLEWEIHACKLIERGTPLATILTWKTAEIGMQDGHDFGPSFSSLLDDHADGDIIDYTVNGKPLRVPVWTLPTWAAKHGMTIVTPRIEAAQENPAIVKWTDLLLETFDGMTGPSTKWVYHDTIFKRTGVVIEDHLDLWHSRAACDRAQAARPGSNIYPHTYNRYAGEVPKDRYFVVGRP